MAAILIPDLREAERLLHAGMRLVKLKRHLKQPEGHDWNHERNFAKAIDRNATGYGVPLEPNRLCSVDPDNWPLAVKGMAALGFDLEALMAAGVRTRSTRPGSGGRSAFQADGEIGWVKFRSKATGTVLELRAHSPNLQDCVPGLVYRTKAGEVCTQTYANGARLDEAPPLPDALWRWWERCSTDLDFLHDQEARFFAALGDVPMRALSAGRVAPGKKVTLAFASMLRMSYNERHDVREVLTRHGYTFHKVLDRWSPPTATGAPGVRQVPGTDGLWASDHASDPLAGLFDAWTAHVVLDHDGDPRAAESAFRVEQGREEFETSVAPADPSAEAPTDTTARGLKTDLEPSIEPPKGEAAPIPEHPLLRFVDLSQEPPAPRWVIPGFVAQGVVMASGGWGVGKTTALLPLAMVAAGLHQAGDPLAPKHWRHVVYITEDVGQALRIIEGMVKHGGLGLDAERVRQRLHLVSAQRMNVDYVAQVATVYRERFSRDVQGVPVLPLVVFDTRSACFDMDDENSNSEAAAIIAVLRQRFESLPVWIVGHVAKAAMSRTDAAGLSSRGGGAWDADVEQTLFLVREGEQRFLLMGKPRFVPRWGELEIQSRAHDVAMRDEFGNPEIVTLRWGIPTPPEQSRKEAREQAQEAARKAETAAMRDEIREAIESAWQRGFPLNREGVRAKVNRKATEVLRTIEALLNEQWLYEVGIPSKIRTNAKRSTFLVNLTTQEHEAVLQGAGMPAEKLEIPPSMRKPEAPPVGNGRE